MAEIEDQFSAVVGDFMSVRGNVERAIQFADTLGADQSDLKITFLNSLIVTITALTEETVRDLFKCYLGLVEVNHANHNQLRADLRRANVEAYVAVLRNAKEPAQYATAHEVTKQLEVCLGSKRGFKLRIDEITLNEGNCRTKQITDISKRAGVREILRQICDCTEVVEWSGEDELDRRVTKFSAEWNSIFDERDVVVHQMSNASGWAADKLLQALHQVDILVNRLSEILSNDASELIETEIRRCAAR